MLADHPMTIVLLAPDLDASKEFYSKKIGLPVISDTPGGVTLGFAVSLVISGTGTARDRLGARAHRSGSGAFVVSAGLVTPLPWRPPDTMGT